MEPHPDRGDMKVWLAEAEVEQLLEAVSGQRWIAIALGARCGLRVGEIVDVRPIDVVDSPTGHRVRVREGKGEKYREVPAPDRLADRVDGYHSGRDADPDTPLVDVTTRTVERWLAGAGEELHDASGDEGWLELSPHDLRRSWGTILLGNEVLPHVVKDWGGWESWETFEEHYLGVASPEVERREIGKVEWL